MSFSRSFRPGALALALLLAGGVKADTLPADRFAVLVVRALAYDAKLHERAGASVDVGVLHRPTDVEGSARAQKLVAAFNGLADLKIEGTPLRALEVPWTTADALAASLKANNIDELVVPAVGFDAERAAIARVCDAAHILRLGDVKAEADKGTALVVDLADGRPTIFINLESSKRAGAELSSGLLRLAIIVKGDK